MTRARKRYSPEFKLKAVIMILKGDKTAGQVTGELGVHPMQLSEWKRQFLERGAQVFEKQKNGTRVDAEMKDQAELFEQIGRLKMEVEWLKKN